MAHGMSRIGSMTGSAAYTSFKTKMASRTLRMPDIAEVRDHTQVLQKRRRLGVFAAAPLALLLVGAYAELLPQPYFVAVQAARRPGKTSAWRKSSRSSPNRSCAPAVRMELLHLSRISRSPEQALGAKLDAVDKCRNRVTGSGGGHAAAHRCDGNARVLTSVSAVREPLNWSEIVAAVVSAAWLQQERRAQTAEAWFGTSFLARIRVITT